MNKPVQILEKEIQQLKSTLFLSEIVASLDALAISLLISTWTQSFLENIYIPNENKTRLATLILIGLTRGTVVRIANDAFFSKDLELRKIELDKLSVEDDRQEPKTIIEEISIKLLRPILWFNIEVIKVLMTAVIDFLSLIKYLKNFPWGQNKTKIKYWSEAKTAYMKKYLQI
ncbi:hypothetical protein [Aliterella atlantica]|uniref:Uncharacterized protein n=1 Tax=Aliterella atlantica CENA595 TaxID=1618023 RepID=A0A0D8ZMJ7_9CYAN|nr:hypothetical protein [Aliterella atlantica]KJH70058.1 hypothetical protein UH38_20100 [Aliterella atlantica CENA595]